MDEERKKHYGALYERCKEAESNPELMTSHLLLWLGVFRMCPGLETGDKNAWLGIYDADAAEKCIDTFRRLTEWHYQKKI